MRLARDETVREGTTLLRMGKFEPARLDSEEMEYATIQQVLEKLGKLFGPVPVQRINLLGRGDILSYYFR